MHKEFISVFAIIFNTFYNFITLILFFSKEMYEVDCPSPSPAEIASPDSTTFSNGAPNSPNTGALSS